MFKVSSAHQGCIYLNKNTKTKVLLWNSIAILSNFSHFNIFKNVIYSYDAFLCFLLFFQDSLKNRMFKRTAFNLNSIRGDPE